MKVCNDTWIESLFETNSSLAAPCRGAMEEQLERLKEQLLSPLLSSVENAAFVQNLRLVANEAAALAWMTVCPMLVLPALLEEKVSVALKHWQRQQRLWRRANPPQASTKGDSSVLPCLAPVMAVVFPPRPWMDAAPLGSVRSGALVPG